MSARLRPLLLGPLLLGLCAAHAHDRSESTSHWTLANGDLRGVITIRTREITRLTLAGDSDADLPGIFAAHVGRSFTATVDGVPCNPSGDPSILQSEPGFVRVEMRLRCGSGEVLSLTSNLLFAVAPSHSHFTYLEAGSVRGEAILTRPIPSIEMELHSAHETRTHILQFVAMGIEHIASGVDHLAFLLALLIGARSLRQILVIVTGFTLGHSLTLSLAVLGIVQPDRAAVESLIGLTIALAAAQNLIQGEREGRVAAAVAMLIAVSLLLVPGPLRPDMPATLVLAVGTVAASTVWLASARRARTADSGPRGAASEPAPDPATLPRFTMAIGFGLIHGLGFAGALQDLLLPRSLLVPTLFGFNVGVELGQLAVVGAVILLARLATAGLPRARHSEVPAALLSALLLTAGLTWFLTRAVVSP